MSARYFHSENAGRLIAGLKFHIYEIIAGTACGVYSAEDSTQIDALTALIGKSPVREIDKAEYDDCIKKNPPAFNTWRPLAVSSTTNPPLPQALKGPGVVSVRSGEAAEAADAPVEIKTQVASVEEALKVAPVDTAPTAAVPPAEVKEGKSITKTPSVRAARSKTAD